MNFLLILKVSTYEWYNFWGLDSDCVRSEATLTLALPKVGLMSAEVRCYTGDIYLGDISVPPLLLKGLGIESRIPFDRDSIIITK